MEDWQTLLWCCRVGQELSSLPPCCFPSPIQWCKGKGEVKCHLPLPHWWPVWVKSSHWYQGRVELCITMLVQSCSCQVGVEVQIHNKPCWHNGDGKMMCLISLIHLTLLSFFDRVGKKSQFPTSSTVCVCVCVGKVKLPRDCLVMSHHYWVGVEDHRAIWFWQVRDTGSYRNHPSGKLDHHLLQGGRRIGGKLNSPTDSLKPQGRWCSFTIGVGWN